MPGNYSHTSRATGTILTAAIYNADHENHITNATPEGVDDYSGSTSEMQTQSDPGEQGSESLATSLADELAQIRFCLAEMKGTSYWYESSVGSLSEPSSNDLLYNTAFEIWQDGASVTDASSAQVFAADGWQYARAGAGRATIAQETTVVPTVAQTGTFVRASLEITVTTDDTSIASTDVYAIEQIMEGYWAQAIVQRTFTLSFWVRSAVTGVYCVSFRNSGADRSYVAEYTISSANTWEYKTVTVTASPSAGTWDYTNGVGMRVAWAVACGATYQTTAGSWATGNYVATSSQANLFANVGNTFLIACPKITPGPSASRWLALPYEQELTRCQRYYEKSYPLATAPGTAFTADLTNTPYGFYSFHAAGGEQKAFPFKVRKRTDTPTLTLYDGAGTASRTNYYTTGWASGGTLVSTAISATNGAFVHSIASSIATHFQWVANARLT